MYGSPSLGVRGSEAQGISSDLHVPRGPCGTPASGDAPGCTCYLASTKVTRLDSAESVFKPQTRAPWLVVASAEERAKRSMLTLRVHLLISTALDIAVYTYISCCREQSKYSAGKEVTRNRHVSHGCHLNVDEPRASSCSGLLTRSSSSTLLVQPCSWWKLLKWGGHIAH